MKPWLSRPRRISIGGGISSLRRRSSPSFVQKTTVWVRRTASSAWVTASTAVGSRSSPVSSSATTAPQGHDAAVRHASVRQVVLDEMDECARLHHLRDVDGGVDDHRVAVDPDRDVVALDEIMQ